jgi:hypothetical protein
MTPSLVGTGLRGRVERLFRRDIRQQDLRELFFNMRDESGGTGIVSEVANFLAHPAIRTQGMVTQEVRDTFAFWKFRAFLDRSSIVTTDMPASAPKALLGNLRRMRASILLRETGLNKLQARQVLEQIFSRSVLTAGGGMTKLSLATQEELAVAVCVARHLKSGPVFTDNDLFEDFCRALQHQQLLSAAEKDELKKSKAAVTLFALIAMHNRKIDLGDGTTAKLAVAANLRKCLAIYAFGEVAKNARSGTLIVGAYVFETHLRIADYCEPMIAPVQRDAFVGEFEMTSDLKLRRVD